MSEPGKARRKRKLLSLVTVLGTLVCGVAAFLQGPSALNIAGVVLFGGTTLVIVFGG